MQNENLSTSCQKFLPCREAPVQWFFHQNVSSNGGLPPQSSDLEEVQHSYTRYMQSCSWSFQQTGWAWHNWSRLARLERRMRPRKSFHSRIHTATVEIFVQLGRKHFPPKSNQFAVVKTDLAGTVIDVWSTLGWWNHAVVPQGGHIFSKHKLKDGMCCRKKRTEVGLRTCIDKIWNYV